MNPKLPQKSNGDSPGMRVSRSGTQLTSLAENLPVQWSDDPKAAEKAIELQKRRSLEMQQAGVDLFTRLSMPPEHLKTSKNHKTNKVWPTWLVCFVISASRGLPKRSPGTEKETPEG